MQILNGFALPDLDNVIGMKESELRKLLLHLRRLPNGAVVELDRVQTMVLHNALKETLRELGVEELTTRTGYEIDKGEETFRGARKSVKRTASPSKPKRRTH